MTDEKTKTNKKKRHRSPAYPSISLNDAVEKATTFAEAEGLGRIPVGSAVKSLGYESSSSSKGFRTIASLLSFGIFEAEGSGAKRQIWVSPLGKRVIHGERGSTERAQAIKEAALKPDIHKMFWDRYGVKLPSDDTLKAVLITELNFNPHSCEDFIRELRDTYKFMNLAGPDIIAEDRDANEVRGDNIEVNNHHYKSPKNGPNMQEYTIPLIGANMSAVLRVPRPLSKKNYDTLIKWLALLEEPLTVVEGQPTDDEKEAPAKKEAS